MASSVFQTTCGTVVLGSTPVASVSVFRQLNSHCLMSISNEILYSGDAAARKGLLNEDCVIARYLLRRLFGLSGPSERVLNAAIRIPSLRRSPNGSCS